MHCDAAEMSHRVVERVDVLVDLSTWPMCQGSDSMQAMTNLLVVQVSFPGVSVADQERANVRPPNPSLCVGNGFVIEITDLVCSSRRSPIYQTQLLRVPNQLSPTL